MSSEDVKVFTKENMDGYLKELAKEFRKLNGTAMPAEIILIGGAAILANYGFREIITDIDAVIHASSSMKEAVNRVADKFNLPNRWLNADFMRTDSYSLKLSEVSVYYKTFSNLLEIRTVFAEYLIAMKLRAGRKYKNDLSDIVGILAEHEKNDLQAITFRRIDEAVKKLYGGWKGMPPESKSFILKVLDKGDYEAIYDYTMREEEQSRNILLQFEKEYPQIAGEANSNDIINALKSGQSKKKE